MDEEMTPNIKTQYEKDRTPVKKNLEEDFDEYGSFQNKGKTPKDIDLLVNEVGDDREINQPQPHKTHKAQKVKNDNKRFLDDIDEELRMMDEMAFTNDDDDVPHLINVKGDIIVEQDKKTNVLIKSKSDDMNDILNSPNIEEYIDNRLKKDVDDLLTSPTIDDYVKKIFDSTYHIDSHTNLINNRNNDNNFNVNKV